MAYSLIYSRWYAFRQNLAAVLGIFWRYRPNRWYFLISTALQILAWILAFRMFGMLGDDLFVAHYNVDFGIDAIGSPWRVFNIPAAALLVWLFNWLLILVYARNEHFHFLTHATGLTALLVQILNILALFSVYLINFLA